MRKESLAQHISGGPQKSESGEKKWLNDFLLRLQQEREAELEVNAHASEPPEPAVPVMLRLSASKERTLADNEEEDDDEGEREPTPREPKHETEAEKEEKIAKKALRGKMLAEAGSARGASFSFPELPAIQVQEPYTSVRASWSTKTKEEGRMWNSASLSLPRRKYSDRKKRKNKGELAE